MQTKINESAIHSESFLQREKLIRGIGWLMLFAPVGNFLFTAALAGTPHWYMPSMLVAFAQSVPMTFWFLWASTFVVGCTMTLAKKSGLSHRISWQLSLCILGVNFVYGVVDLQHDLKFGKFQPILSLVINFALFSLIYFQEFHRKIEFKSWQTRAPKTKPVPVPVDTPIAAQAPPSVALTIPVAFDGIGEWAKLVEVSLERISLRSHGKAVPANIEKRLIMIALSKNLSVQARFAEKNNLDYHFQFVNLNEAAAAEILRLQAKLAA